MNISEYNKLTDIEKIQKNAKVWKALKYAVDHANENTTLQELCDIAYKYSTSLDQNEKGV